MCGKTGKILWGDEGRAGAFKLSARWGRVKICLQKFDLEVKILKRLLDIDRMISDLDGT